MSQKCFTSNGIVHDLINSCIFFYNVGYVQFLKVHKLLINNQTRASNECELVSKSIITAFNFLLASEMFCLSNIYG